MNEPNKDEGGQFVELLNTLGKFILKSGDSVRSFRENVLKDLDDRLAEIAETFGDDEVDPFGMEPKALKQTAVGAAFLYKVYFRCISKGLENVPEGPVILVANHAGQLPIDGVMITTALVLDRKPPRFARSLVDRWVPSLPFVSTFYSRIGMAVGTPENAELLLKRGEVLLSFPEGMEAISKTVEHAYKLKNFSQGFMRLALSTGTPIVPVAVVGSEEQYPTLYNLKNLGKFIGLPTLPIWAQMVVPVLGLLPLPVRYHLQFGEPMTFEGDPDDEDAVIASMVTEVQEKIANMLDEVRAGRRSIFF